METFKYSFINYLIALFGVVFFNVGFEISYTYFDRIDTSTERYTDGELVNTEVIGVSDINIGPLQETIKLYSKPNESSGIVGEIDESDHVKVIDTAAGWYRVLLPSGESGWVKIADLALD